MLVCPPVASSAPRQLGTLAASRTSPSSGAIAGWWNEPCLGWRFGTRRRTRREQSTTLHFNQVLDTSVGGRVDVVLPYSAVDGERAVTMRELHCLKTPASIDHSNRLPLTRSPPSASDQYRSGRSLHEIAAMSGITMRQCQIGGALDSRAERLIRPSVSASSPLTISKLRTPGHGPRTFKGARDRFDAPCCFRQPPACSHCPTARYR